MEGPQNVSGGLNIFAKKFDQQDLNNLCKILQLLSILTKFKSQFSRCGSITKCHYIPFWVSLATLIVFQLPVLICCARIFPLMYIMTSTQKGWQTFHNSLCVDILHLQGSSLI